MFIRNMSGKSQNVYFYEVYGEINAITVDNSSVADESTVRFLLGKE